ncbi:hypothetical protein PR048_027770 [Dryococelus australis]|uniref:Uncharacterized protein n=1 Tax=Dryococelus australis TaxID=614101 RepID=A0ABQ9GHF2_9NEOP|nr:hypothetical protein PR048_027770 [Dryococelus australis]
MPRRLYEQGTELACSLVPADSSLEILGDDTTIYLAEIDQRCAECPGAMVAERLAYSSPTTANRVQSPAGSPGFRKWESCRTMPLVGGFFFVGLSRFPRTFTPAPLHTSFTLIGCQDVSVESRPNLFTHSHAQSSRKLGIKSSASICLVWLNDWGERKTDCGYNGQQLRIAECQRLAVPSAAAADGKLTVVCASGHSGLIGWGFHALPSSSQLGLLARSFIEDALILTPRRMCRLVLTAVERARLWSTALAMVATAQAHREAWYLLSCSYTLLPTELWGRGGTVARALVSHRGDPGTIPGGFTPGFSHVGIVLDDVACRRVFSGYSRFPRTCIPALLRPRVSFHAMSGDDGHLRSQLESLSL